MGDVLPMTSCKVSGFSICLPQYPALKPGCEAMVRRVDCHTSVTSTEERSREGFKGR